MDLAEAVAGSSCDLNLVFIGDGPLRAAVEEAAATVPRTRFLGFVNQPELGEWYGAAEVFVLPSEREPWGLVVNEAMAAGAVPIVTDTVGAAPDLVAHDAGIVVPVGDARALALAIDRLISDPDALSTMRQRGRDRIAQFSLQETAHGIEQAAVAAVGQRSHK